jgi:hypothetical protein
VARALPDYSFNKRELVEALSLGREGYVVRGSVTGFRGHNPVEAVVLRAGGSNTEVELRAQAVVLAAGCGSKQLLRTLVGDTPQLKRIKHRVVHMLCLRSIFDAPDLETARTLLAQVVADYEPQAPTAIATLERGFDDATAVLALPRPYRKRLRTTNGKERRERGSPSARARHPHLSQSPVRHALAGSPSDGAR